MRKIMMAAMAAAMGLSISMSQSVAAKNLVKVDVKPFAAKRYARLPAAVQHPEGITAIPRSRELVVGTFNPGGENVLLRLRRSGRVAAGMSFGTTPLLGLAYNPADGMIYIANFGAGEIQRVPSDFNRATLPETVATVELIGAPPPRTVVNPDGTTEDLITFAEPAIPAPNGLAFDSDGNLYFSDSFQGAIFRIADADTCVTPCDVERVIQDGLLATAGQPGFGANGIAFNADQSMLYVANSGDDRLLAVDITNTRPVPVVNIVAEGIDGADGVIVDESGSIWVAANQADQVVVLDPDGRVSARLGAFHAVRRNGEVRGLLFPASLVKLRRSVFVTNLALPLTGGPGFEDDEPEDAVSLFTISRLASGRYTRPDRDDDSSDKSSDDKSKDDKSRD